MTFAGTPDDHTLIKGLPFGISCADSLRASAEEFVSGIGGVPVWIPDEHRSLYHASIVFGANFIITLTATAMDLLSRMDVEDPGQLIAPLFMTSLRNTFVLRDEALTGPVRRGDVGTISSHLETLAEVEATVVPAYVELARLTAQRAIKENLSPTGRSKAVLRLLRDCEFGQGWATTSETSGENS